MNFWGGLITFISGSALTIAVAMIASHVSDAAKEIIGKCLGM